MRNLAYARRLTPARNEDPDVETKAEKCPATVKDGNGLDWRALQRKLSGRAIRPAFKELR